MSDRLDFGEVVLPAWKLELSSQQSIPFREVESEHGTRAAYMQQDVAFVRTWVRKHRYGESGDYGSYSVDVVWPDGETATWLFDRHVGWPVEVGNEDRDWHGEWMRNYGKGA